MPFLSLLTIFVTLLLDLLAAKNRKSTSMSRAINSYGHRLPRRNQGTIDQAASALRYLTRHSEQTNSIRIKKLNHSSKEPPTASDDTRKSSLTSDIGST